jgi:alpha-L-rhamnosidase
MLESDRRDTYQVARRVLVASSVDLLNDGKPDLWDSGRVEARGEIGIEYAGSPLASRMTCWWGVTAWDNHGQSASLAQPSLIEMSLLESTDWKAQWVGYSGGWTGRALQFRRSFNIDPGKKVSRARAYFVGLGYGELYLNGRKVGDRVLDPGWTAYQKRVLYNTDDVAGSLQAGENRVGVILGHGWYGDRKFLLQLEIEYQDGGREQVLSNWGWRVTPSAIVADSIYEGEIYDARLELPGWCDPNAPEPPPRKRTLGWQQAMIVEPPAGRLVAAANEPIRVVETIQPRSMEEVSPGVWVFDVGRNIAGWARIRVRGETGQRIHLRFAESLNPDGTVNQENLRDARAEDVYILRGAGLEEWEPRFTYHGFRYIQVEGWPGEPRIDSLDARVVRSAIKERGHFSCDHALLNAIQTMVVRTEASNLHSVPTDCPQRDERLGWMNDLTARAEESICNFDLVRFYHKWLDDIADAQSASGAIPDTVPHRYCFQPADPVCIGYLLLPWLLYQHYGDRMILRKHRDGMRAWVECLDAESNNNLLSRSYYGDWAPPVYRKGLPTPPEDTAHNRDTPGELVSTAFLAMTCRLYSKIAEVLDDRADATKFSDRADQIARAFHERFFVSSRGGYGSCNQSCNTLALYAGMVPEQYHQGVLRGLVKDVTSVQSGHLATGNICTKYLMEVLADHGAMAVAMQIATTTEYPGWGYMIENGATTLWERWENATGSGMNSHNHAMLGSISSWFYRAIAGLQIIEPDERGLRLRIKPGISTGLNRAAATLATIAGPSLVEWRRVNQEIHLNLEVPPSASAEVVLPHLPSAPVARVTIDGLTIFDDGTGQPASGISAAENVQDGVRCQVGSGRYLFRIEHASQPEEHMASPHPDVIVGREGQEQ